MYIVSSSIPTESPIILINSHIGFDTEQGMGIDGAIFQRELLELDEKGYKSIQVWINSPGGVVMDGYNIYNAILKTKTPVDTFCVGMAASIAAVIFQAGRKRTMSDYSRLMFHNPYGGDDKKALSAIQSSIVTMIASRSKKHEDEIAAIMDKTSWILPEDAKALGLCDSIELSNQYNLKHGNVKSFLDQGNIVINSLLNINQKMETVVQAKASLSLIAAYLELNTEATENAILAEVKNRVNKEILAKQKAEESMDAMKKALDKMKEQYDSLQAQYDAKVKEAKDAADLSVKEKEQADKEAKNAAAEITKVKAKAMVEGHSKLGRIKIEAINSWVNKAVEDFDGVDSLLKDLPVTKNAAKFEPKEGLNDATKVPMNAANLMANIQNNLK